MADVGIHIKDMPKAASPAADGEIHEASGQVPVDLSEEEDLKSHTFFVEDAVFRIPSGWRPPQFMIKILVIIIVLVFAPLVLPLALVLITFFGGAMLWSPKGRKIRGVYERVFLFEPVWAKIQLLAMVNIARMGCLALSWLVISLRVPSLKTETMLGTPMWKWSLLAAVVFYGHPFALVAYSFALMIGFIIYHPGFEHDKTYFWVCLGVSLSWLLYSALILIVWLAYFHTEHGFKKNPETVDKYVTWTLVSFLVSTVLGVGKAAVVHHWKAKAIYRRFKPRILMAGFQLYFLCIFVNEFARPSLMPWRYQNKNFGGWKLIEDKRETHITEKIKRRGIQEYFLSARVSLPRLSMVAETLASLAQVLREDDGIVEVEEKCEKKISNVGDGQEFREHIVRLFEELSKDAVEYECRSPGVVRKTIESNIGEDENKEKKRLTNTAVAIIGIYKKLFKRLDRSSLPDPQNWLGDDISGELMKDGANLLLEEVKAQQSSDEITDQEIFHKWMVDAHKDCLLLGYTLVDATAVVNVLDWVLTWAIVAVIILFWLIATGLATTAVLVTIVSPFLALTFMFGDTFKAFFQGAIFSFATHPFDVGDECVIDGEELVVKNINILTTTFHGNKNNDIVLLPNSALATKRIAVHKTGTRTKNKDASTQADDSPRRESPVPPASFN